MEGRPVNPTILYWIAIIALCVCFPPLFGFVLGLAVYSLLCWFWFKVLGG